MARTSKNPAIGSSFDPFLAEARSARTLNRRRHQTRHRLATRRSDEGPGVTKKALAEKMHTSRSHLNRLLDDRDTGLTIETLGKAARALGRNVRIELCEA